MANIYTGDKKNIRNYEGKFLSYPLNLGEYRSTTDYVRFTFYKTTGAFDQGFQGTSSGNNPSSSTAAPAAINKNDVARANRDPVQRKAANYPSAIYLYIPENLSTTFKSQWEGKESPAIVKDTLVGTTNIADLVKSFGTNIAGENSTQALGKLTAELGKITGSKLTVDDVFALTKGVVVNPNTELLFQQHDLRTFQLKYKFSPQNQREAAQVRNICDCFRRCSLPYYGSSGDIITILDFGAENFLRVPDLCKVEFYYKTEKHPYLPVYNSCAISDVDINFTPDNRYATFIDGSPVATELKIGFIETKLQYNQSIYNAN